MGTLPIFLRELRQCIGHRYAFTIILRSQSSISALCGQPKSNWRSHGEGEHFRECRNAA